MKSNPIGWFEIYVQDMARARKFYEAVFAVKLDKLPSGDIEMWSFPMQPEAPGSGGSLSPRGDWRAPSDGEAAAWLDELEANVPGP